ncbi:electron transport complex protein RnfC, partial [Salmonella enterica subsp. enterica serovar Enteritidis str. CDC_2010K_1810]
RVKPRWKRPSPAPKPVRQEQQAGSEPAEPADPRKAAVAAAIARVQAKKAAQQQVVNED